MTLIEQLLDLEIPKDVKLSPNAQQVLYSTTLPIGHKKGEHHLSTIWLAETGKPKSARQLTSGQHNDHSPIWHPDGRSIAFVSDQGMPGERSAMWTLSVEEGSEPQSLTFIEDTQSIEHIAFSPDGKSIAYLSADEEHEKDYPRESEEDDVKVWGEDWAYGRLRIVAAREEITSLVMRDAHVTDFAWNDEGTALAFAETQTPDVESPFLYGTTISTVNVASLQISAVCHFPKSLDSLTWAGDRLYFIGGVEDSSITANMVYSVDLTAEKPSYENYAHGIEDCAVEVSKAGKDVTVLVQHGMEDQIRMLGGQTMLSSKKGITAWDAQFTKDSDEVVIAVAQGETARSPEIFTTTASGGALVQVSEHGHAFADRSLGSANFFKCTSADGQVELDAVYLIPPNVEIKDGIPSKSLPTVVYPHHGPYHRNNDSFNPTLHMWSPLLLEAGYSILLPNYRGSSGRGNAFASAIRGTAGTVDYDDVISITQSAIEKGYADKERLVVAGWSQGGYLSSLCTVRNGLHGHGWKFKAAITGAGVADWDTICFTSSNSVFQGDLKGGLPWKSDKEDTSARARSPGWEIKAAVEKGGVIPPMLILHGEEDRNVPMEQSMALRRALEDAKLPFEFLVYPKEGHVFNERRHIVDMAERVVRFVKKQV